MRTPPKVTILPEKIFVSDLFAHEEILRLAIRIEPWFDLSRAKVMAREMDDIVSFGLIDGQSNSPTQERFYAKLESDIRRLLNTLELPTKPNVLAEKFPLGVNLFDENYPYDCKAPSGLAWLLEGGSNATFASRDFAVLVANALRDPEDPGDWISPEETVDWESFADFVADEIEKSSDKNSPEQTRASLTSSLGRLNEQRATFEAELVKAELPLRWLSSTVKAYSLFLMANHGLNALDTLDLAMARA
jgi:hypothetical protein